jgi:hypothetical protein
MSNRVNNTAVKQVTQANLPFYERDTPVVTEMLEAQKMRGKKPPSSTSSVGLEEAGDGA